MPKPKPRRAKRRLTRWDWIAAIAMIVIWVAVGTVIIRVATHLRDAQLGFYQPTTSSPEPSATPTPKPTLTISHRPGVYPWELCSAHPNPSCPSPPPTACPTKFDPGTEQFFPCRNRK